MADLSTGKPYSEYEEFDYTVRIFDESVSGDDLVWHRDKNTRLISVVDANEWMFQFDNELPFQLRDHMIFLIPKETYHRLIKGNGTLKIKIRE